MKVVVVGCRGIAPTGSTALRTLERRKKEKEERKR